MVREKHVGRLATHDWSSFIGTACCAFYFMYFFHQGSSIPLLTIRSAPRYNGLIHRIGPVFAIVIATGNILMPVAVLLGWIQLPAGVLQ